MAETLGPAYFFGYLPRSLIMLSSIHFGAILLLVLAGPLARASDVSKELSPDHESSVAKRRKSHKVSHTVTVRHRSRTVRTRQGLHGGTARKTDRKFPGEEFPGRDRGNDPSRALSYQFAVQRGRLSWPVDSRKVSVHFGYYSYLPNVKGNSRCITIEVEGDQDVRAVCDGEVESVMDLGDAKAVLLRHGKYFTVYSNLPEVAVAKGDCVKEGQVLGRITGDGTLDFYVYYENDNWFFDPEKWLKR